MKFDIAAPQQILRAALSPMLLRHQRTVIMYTQPLPFESE